MEWVRQLQLYTVSHLPQAVPFPVRSLLEALGGNTVEKREAVQVLWVSSNKSRGVRTER